MLGENTMTNTSMNCIAITLPIGLSGAGRAENRIAVGRVEMPQNSRAIDYCYLKSCIFERRNDALRNQFCFLWV